MEEGQPNLEHLGEPEQVWRGVDVMLRRGALRLTAVAESYLEPRLARGREPSWVGYLLVGSLGCHCPATRVLDGHHVKVPGAFRRTATTDGEGALTDARKIVQLRLIGV